MRTLTHLLAPTYPPRPVSHLGRSSEDGILKEQCLTSPREPTYETIPSYCCCPGGGHGRPGRAAPPLSPFESDAEPAAQGRIDELVLGRLKQLGITPAKVCSDGVFVRRAYLDVIGTLPTADEARQFLNDSDPDKRRKLVDRLAGARRVRRLLGHEVVRPAAGQVGVPHQAVAQCGAGLSPLDSHEHPRQHALRPVRPRDAHGQRQQFPRPAGELLPRRAEPRAAGHRPGRGAELHGSAAGKLAQRAVVGHGGLLLADRLQAHRRMEGRDRPVRSREGPQPAGRASRCGRPPFPTGRRSA